MKKQTNIIKKIILDIDSYIYHSDILNIISLYNNLNSTKNVTNKTFNPNIISDFYQLPPNHLNKPKIFYDDENNECFDLLDLFENFLNSSKTLYLVKLNSDSTLTL